MDGNVTAGPGAADSRVGRPLGQQTRDLFAPALGPALNTVRVHDDPQARTLAGLWDARAFTRGSEIWLGAGESEQDRALMAHELAHVALHSGLGDSPHEVLRQTIASQLPQGVGATSASLFVQLPEAKLLMAGSLYGVSTKSRTDVELQLTPATLSVTFAPALLIDAQWPASNMECSGVSYDFTTGRISWIGLTSTQTGFNVESRAQDAISAYFMSLLSGSRMTQPGYDPLLDPDIVQTLNTIKTNFNSAPSSGGEVTPAEATAPTVTMAISLATPIDESTPEGGVSISGGLSISVELSGTLETASQQSTPAVHLIRISGPSMIVKKQGADVAQIHDLEILPGGTVDIRRMTLLGSVAQAAHTEEAVRLLGVIMMLSGGRPEDRLRVASANPNMEATVVPGVARETIEDALGRALRRLVIENAHIIPGYDLTTIFGISPP